MPAHTPGPWHKDSIDQVRTATGVVVARCERRERHEYMDSHEQSANARLIAAAPALLEALEAFFKPPSEGGFTNVYDWTDKARAAIAQAKGESK